MTRWWWLLLLLVPSLGEARVLTFHVPSFQADTLGDCLPDSTAPAHIARVLLYSQASILPVRSHPASAGMPDTFQVPDDDMEWAVVAENQAGRPGCWAWVRVGSPRVSVPPSPAVPWEHEDRAVWYDVATGRRVRVFTTRNGHLEPVHPGVYIERLEQRHRRVTVH